MPWQLQLRLLLIFWPQVLCQQPDEYPWRLVTQEIDCISVAHFDENKRIFFWDDVQGEWSLLYTCFDSHDMEVGTDGERWYLYWSDLSGDCRRMVYTKVWLESWESTDPMLVVNKAPWFRRNCVVGLKKPE